MWMAYATEIRRVQIVQKGTGGVRFKQGAKPHIPYVVYDEIDEEEFVVSIDDLHHNPRDAEADYLRRAKEHGVVVPEGQPLSSNPVEEEEDEEDEDDAGEDEDEDEEDDGTEEDDEEYGDDD